MQICRNVNPSLNLKSFKLKTFLVAWRKKAGLTGQLCKGFVTRLDVLELSLQEFLLLAFLLQNLGRV